MKKILTIIGIFGLTLIKAQVGINTENDPDASADLELGSNNKALLLNRVTDVSTINNPKVGMLIFDASADYGCLRIYQKSGWTGCFTSGATENTTASIADKTETLVVYTHNDITHNKINNTTDVRIIKIPYTNASGSYDRVSVTTMAAPGEGGDTNTLTLTIPGGTFSTNGELTATIKVGGADEEYLVSKTDTYTIATFPIMMNGISFKVILKSIAGIRDRNFGDGKHDFIYLPVEVTSTYSVNGQPYKKTWLNMNLGADYAKVGSSDFDPTVNKTGTAAHSDSKTYGSLFQWQRKADGHEFRNSTTTYNLATSWTHTSTSFIIDNENWLSNNVNATGTNLQLWQIGGINNPCPEGYHVPTIAEWTDLHEAITGYRPQVHNSNFWNQTILPNLAATGFREHEDGSKTSIGSRGAYWSSESSSGSFSTSLYFHQKGSFPGGNRSRGYGFSVRCIKD